MVASASVPGPSLWAWCHRVGEGVGVGVRVGAGVSFSSETPEAAASGVGLTVYVGAAVCSALTGAAVLFRVVMATTVNTSARHKTTISQRICCRFMVLTHSVIAHAQVVGAR